MRHRQLAKAVGNSYPYRLTATASFLDSTEADLKVPLEPHLTYALTTSLGLEAFVS